MHGADELTLALIVGASALAFLLLAFAYWYDMRRRRPSRRSSLFLEDVIVSEGDGVPGRRSERRTRGGRRVAWRPHGSRPGGYRDGTADAGVFPILFVGGDDGGASCGSDGGGGSCDGGGG